jgi:uncharacterized membrane protein YeaQ/YmgE (transglycosylase-associated protein family)
MSFIVAIIIGGIIGWLASLIMKTNAQMGLLANIIVGIVGSVLGHWAAGALGIAASGPSGASSSAARRGDPDRDPAGDGLFR